MGCTQPMSDSVNTLALKCATSPILAHPFTRGGDENETVRFSGTAAVRVFNIRIGKARTLIA